MAMRGRWSKCLVSMSGKSNKIHCLVQLSSANEIAYLFSSDNLLTRNGKCVSEKKELMKLQWELLSPV